MRTLPSFSLLRVGSFVFVSVTCRQRGAEHVGVERPDRQGAGQSGRCHRLRNRFDDGFLVCVICRVAESSSASVVKEYLDRQASHRKGFLRVEETTGRAWFMGHSLPELVDLLLLLLPLLTMLLRSLLCCSPQSRRKGLWRTWGTATAPWKAGGIAELHPTSFHGRYRSPAPPSLPPSPSPSSFPSCFGALVEFSCHTSTMFRCTAVVSLGQREHSNSMLTFDYLTTGGLMDPSQRPFFLRAGQGQG